MNLLDEELVIIDVCSVLMQMTLKCADICNPCRPWPLYYRWSEMICEEFFKQGIYSSFMLFCVNNLSNNDHKTGVIQARLLLFL